VKTFRGNVVMHSLAYLTVGLSCTNDW